MYEDDQSPNVTDAAAIRCRLHVLAIANGCVVERVYLESTSVRICYQAALDEATFPRYLQRVMMSKAEQIQSAGRVSKRLHVRLGRL